jgi:hypothetical protein
MIAEDIKLIGQFINHDTSHKNWWDEYKKGEKFAQEIKKKNALPLQEIYKKMYDDGIHYLRLHFEGGHDEGGFDESFEYFDNDKVNIDHSSISLNNYKPNGWITVHKPLQYQDDKTKTIQVFELVTTDYSDIQLTESWLVQKWYDFGFLEEWGSFAFEGHVNGHVEVSTKDGSYTVEADETFESYEGKNFEGNMFKD